MPTQLIVNIREVLPKGNIPIERRVGLRMSTSVAHYVDNFRTSEDDNRNIKIAENLTKKPPYPVQNLGGQPPRPDTTSRNAEKGSYNNSFESRMITSLKTGDVSKYFRLSMIHCQPERTHQTKIRHILECTSFMFSGHVMQGSNVSTVIKNLFKRTSLFLIHEYDYKNSYRS